MDGEISVAELAELLAESDGGGESVDEENDDLHIVDIRGERSFRRGHIPGSVCIPFPKLTTRVAELDGADRIVTVCPHGISSKQAAQLLASYEGTADARIESLHGGLDEWQRDHELVTAESAGDGDAGKSGDAAPTAEPDEGPDAPF
ncbi:rhodanese-like domain-containing protein [Halorubrum gandharaense]